MSAIAPFQSVRALFSSRKSGLSALDMAAVYHYRLSLFRYLEKGDQNGQRTSDCFTAPTIRYEKIRSQSPYFSKGLGSVG
ncbi:hypothetical protein JP0521_12540 [Helicobacter pylori]|nr:hypothetical protein JP0521_12540 [Helicobacter pylori]